MTESCRITKIPGGDTAAKHSYTYDDLGQIASWERKAQLANPGATHEFQWTLAHDFSGQLTSAVEKSLTGSLRDSWSFGYDAAGNRFSATRSGAPGSTAQAMTATHNTMNQLTTLGGGGRTIVSGALDEPGQVSVGIAGQGDKPARMLSGNRFEAEVVLPSGTSTLDVTAADAQGNTAHKQYSVATAPQTARTMTYDADGNMTGDGERTYEWDAWSHLTKITWATGKTADISYNALGLRSKLVHTDGTTTRTEYYLYDGAEVLQRRTNGTAASNTDCVYFAQGERRKTGSTWSNQHYTRDHLGSIREVLASDGTLLARYDYTPYGERETCYEASSYTGTDFGFTGHFTLDSPVAGQQDLVLAHFRAYDPLIGRWLSQDPIREAGGVNLYGYVGGRVADAVDLFGFNALPVGGGYNMFVVNPQNFIDIYGKIFQTVRSLVRGASTVRISHPNANFSGQCATGAQYLAGTTSNGKFYDAPSTPTWRKGPSVFGGRKFPEGTMVARGWENDRYPSRNPGDYPSGTPSGKINHVGILVRQIGVNKIVVLQQNPLPMAEGTFDSSEDWHVVLSKDEFDSSGPSRCGIER